MAPFAGLSRYAFAIYLVHMPFFIGWLTTHAVSESALRDDYFKLMSALFVVGFAGTILHSTDGASFSPVTSGTSTNLLAVWGSSATDVYAVGGMGGVPGVIVHGNASGFAPQPVTTAVSHSLAVGKSSAGGGCQPSAA